MSHLSVLISGDEGEVDEVRALQLLADRGGDTITSRPLAILFGFSSHSRPSGRFVRLQARGLVDDRRSALQRVAAPVLAARRPPSTEEACDVPPSRYSPRPRGWSTAPASPRRAPRHARWLLWLDNHDQRRYRFEKRIVPVILALALLVPSAALAQSPSSVVRPVARAASFDKTNFVFDVGTASFAIHRYIYAPYQKDHIKGLKAKIKAAVAAAFAINRLKAACSIAQSGNSKLLKSIVRPLNAPTGQLATISSEVKRGDTSAVPSANNSLSALSGAAKGAGVPFKDVPASV